MTLVLGDLYAKSSGAIDPKRFPDEEFDLLSVPAHDRGKPDLEFGRDIGSTKVPVEPGDVLICKIVPHIRRVWVVPPKRERRQIASGEWIVLRGDQFDANYLRHFLLSNSFHTKFMATVAGVGGSLMRARPAHAASIEILLPPLPEQRRIASILDRADGLRASVEVKSSLSDEMEASLFQEIVGHPALHRDESPLQRIDSFALTRLGKMLDGSRQTGASPKPYLRNANVQWGHFDLSDLLTMDFDISDQLEFSLRRGDVLVCEGGQPGRCAIWDQDDSDIYFQKALHRVRLDRSVMVPEVFVWSMRLLVLGGHLADVVSSATIAHLTGEKLKALKVPVPSMEKQRKFVQLADLNRRSISNAKTRADKLDELFASLQHRAFSGQL